MLRNDEKFIRVPPFMFNSGGILRIVIIFFYSNVYLKACEHVGKVLRKYVDRFLIWEHKN